MVKCKEILGFLYEYANPILAEKWDNVGLIVGNTEQEIKNVIVSLDLTDKVIDEAIETDAQLIITHHPAIFDGIKKLNNETSLGNKILKLVKNDISYIAMHTNMDSAQGGVNDALCEILEIKNVSFPDESVCGRIGNIDETTYYNLLKLIKERLDIPFIKFTGNISDNVTKVAVCGGSGGDFIDYYKTQGAEVYITSDLKYHQAQKASEEGFKIVDTGHFESEAVIVSKIRKILIEKFMSELNVNETATHTSSFWSYL